MHLQLHVIAVPARVPIAWARSSLSYIMACCCSQETFSINPATFNDFLMDLEQHYDPSNAYHNSVHVADVLQTLSVITSGLIAFDPTPTELLLLFLAAACHDVGHKGLNNPFYEEAKIRHDETARADAGADLSSVGPELSCYAEYAAEAGDGGANEYHHATLGWQLLERHGVLGSLGVQEKAQVRGQCSLVDLLKGLAAAQSRLQCYFAVVCEAPYSTTCYNNFSSRECIHVARPSSKDAYTYRIILIRLISPSIPGLSLAILRDNHV